MPRHVIDSTDFDLTEVTIAPWGTASILDAQPLATTNIFGQTESYKFPGYHYKIIYLNINPHLIYSTYEGVCNPDYGFVSVSYILNYEFGHLAGLNHHIGWPFGSEHTAMKRGCNAGQASLSPTDIADINRYYT